ncbi:DnaJ domain protein [Talaromyces stipitatus ATCC 10500]|uniref:DnaJ domain protein n=1 Tax=Talaromyces stipitatus (strain ATCC 10500 / CBS 375.48 / QM 6759 / NRRL 1006) TaxID=441959 RepID=B8LUH1_TALSN|nr:DnaJ domain protein [Talaromyces stipitatus ATCC 10500]EED23744.1 DnaJ domain protein [Talaromyces stipitatus ATCC 10500]
MPPRLTILRLISSFVITPRLNPKPELCGRDIVSPSPSIIFSAHFSATKRYYARSHEPTYYEILNVPVTATAAEIKKQFYALSLKHHPDRNRSDPKATERFATISSAYHILGDSTKRARYDLDHGIGGTTHGTHSSGVAGQHPMGSHSSAGATYAGSRPASGLSKRRTAFRGPPPSFYAHGGYGGRKPQSPGGSYTGTAGTGKQHQHNNEDPTSFINNNPVWHFNARGHYKTQTAEDARRKQRRSQQMQREREILESEKGGSFVLRFVIVSGILVVTAAFGALLGRGSNTATASSPGGKRSGKTSQGKGLGSREDGD